MYISIKRSLIIFSILILAVLLLAVGDWAMEYLEIDSLLVRALWHGAIISGTVFVLPSKAQAYRPFAAGRLQRFILSTLAIALLYMLSSGL